MPKKLMKDFEVDLETLGRARGCVVLSIGAVCLDKDGLGAEFYEVVSRKSCTDAGLAIDPDTLAWWDKQGMSAKSLLDATELPSTTPLKKALVGLSEFVYANCGDGARPWGNGASFDVPILEGAFDAVGLPVPWKFWDHRCYRTMRDHWLPWVKDQPFSGVKHHALDDARHQAKHLQRILALRAQAMASLPGG